MSKENKGILTDLATYGQSGMTFSLSIVIGLGMGWYLDNKVFDGRTAPWFSFIFLGFGIAAGFRHLWDLNKRISGDDGSEE
jgi:ATP synthase protein I